MRWRGALVAALVGFVVLAPLVPVALWSVAGSWFPPDLLPQRFSTRGFHVLMASGGASALADSVWVAGTVALLAVTLAYPAGRALGLTRHWARPAVVGLLLAPALMPTMAMALGLHMRFITLGLADTVLGVVLAHLVPALPYAIVAVSATFARYDPRYEEAARNLGAGRLRVVRTVVLPNVGPGLVVAALFALLISWSQYTLTMVVGGGVVVTLPVLLYTMASGGDLHLIAAACVVFVAPVLLLLPVTGRALTGTALGGRG